MYILCDKYKVADYAASHLHRINKRHCRQRYVFIPDTFWKIEARYCLLPTLCLLAWFVIVHVHQGLWLVCSCKHFFYPLTPFHVLFFMVDNMEILRGYYHCYQ